MAGLYQFRIDEQEKSSAFAVIESYGLTPAQVLRSFLVEIGQTKRIPLSLDYHANHQPNTETAALLQAVREGREPMLEAGSVDELMEALGTQD